jgi:carboxypeptidase PM20D1
MTGASDARFFDRVSEQCIRFLPFTIRREQMDSIHGVNEYLDLSTLAPAVAFYRYMIQHV